MNYHLVVIMIGETIDETTHRIVVAVVGDAVVADMVEDMLGVEAVVVVDIAAAVVEAVVEAVEDINRETDDAMTLLPIIIMLVTTTAEEVVVVVTVVIMLEIDSKNVLIPEIDRRKPCVLCKPC